MKQGILGAFLAASMLGGYAKYPGDRQKIESSDYEANRRANIRHAHNKMVRRQKAKARRKGGKK